MRATTNLSTFDRVGIWVVALLGTPIGLMIATALDLRVTPTLALIVFPGLPVGVVATRLFGTSVGAFVSALSNGAAYGPLR